MKELLYVRYGLSSLQWVTRFVYTLFLGFCLASYVIMFLMGSQRTGFGLEEIALYYAGNEEAFAAGEIDVEDYRPAKPREFLYDQTHFHLFSMPLLLFLQGHLFLLTTLPRRFKVAVVLAAFGGAACDLAAPWLIIDLSTDFAVVKAAGRLLLGPALLLFAAVPLYEMWIKPPRRARREKGPL